MTVWWRLARGVAACLVAVAALPAGAQGGQHAALVLELPASARALALGGAATALPGDDASIFYNPAQLASSSGSQASLSLQRHLQSSTLAALSLSSPVGRGVAGIGVQVLDYGSEAEIIPDPAFGGERGMATGGRVSAGDLAASAGYGVSLGRVRVGAAAKLVQQRIAGSSGSATAFDLGVAADAPLGLTVAASVQNVGSELSLAGERAPLPRMVRLGGSIPLGAMGPRRGTRDEGRGTRDGEHTRHALFRGKLSILATGELLQVQGNRARPSGGAEGSWRSGGGLALIARLGLQARPEGSAATRLTMGGGVSGRHLGLDYAYQGYETVGGAAHRVGARWWR